jgi:hypothetical protein
MPAGASAGASPARPAPINAPPNRRFHDDDAGDLVARRARPDFRLRPILRDAALCAALRMSAEVANANDRGEGGEQGDCFSGLMLRRSPGESAAVVSKHGRNGQCSRPCLRSFPRHSRESGNSAPHNESVALGPRLRGDDGGESRGRKERGLANATPPVLFGRRRVRPRLCSFDPPEEGARNAGRLASPRPHVRLCINKHMSTSPQESRTRRRSARGV